MHLILYTCLKIVVFCDENACFDLHLFQHIFKRAKTSVMQNSHFNTVMQNSHFNKTECESWGVDGQLMFMLMVFVSTRSLYMKGLFL